MSAAMTQPSMTLRRAVYVHISDLTSAYNIDNAKLEEELTRVRKETLMATNKSDDPGLVHAPTAMMGVPTELDTSASSQRRLHPPRVGYNLCLYVRASGAFCYEAFACKSPFCHAWLVNIHLASCFLDNSLVGKVSVVVDKRRVDGSRVRLAEVEVGDETGIVSLRARDDQIDILEEVSSRSGAVVVRNCTLELYQGKHIRLAITKWGKLRRYPDQIASTPAPPSKINRDRNFSLIDLSKVASEMVSYPASADSYHQGQETENQANRVQQYSSGGRRGRRPPAGTRAKQAPGQGHYGDVAAALQSAAVTYPVTGLHGYGGIESRPYLYQSRQPDAIPPQQQRQQILVRQQYDMQQHHRPVHQARPHLGGYAQDRMGPPSTVSTTMMNQGLVPQTGSFDSTPFGMTSNPFMVSIPSLSTSSGSSPNQTVPMSAASGAVRDDSPQGKMNPQAATFDPSTFRK
jgi:replication factor A1